jgi:hypothetical protein
MSALRKKVMKDSFSSKGWYAPNKPEEEVAPTLLNSTILNAQKPNTRIKNKRIGKKRQPKYRTF